MVRLMSVLLGHKKDISFASMRLLEWPGHEHAEAPQGVCRIAGGIGVTDEDGIDIRCSIGAAVEERVLLSMQV